MWYNQKKKLLEPSSINFENRDIAKNLIINGAMRFMTVKVMIEQPIRRD